MRTMMLAAAVFVLALTLSTLAGDAGTVPGGINMSGQMSAGGQMPGQMQGQMPGQYPMGQTPGQMMPGQQYPGNPGMGQMPGQYPMGQMPGQMPGQYPMNPGMGQMPGQMMPGQMPGQMPMGMPNFSGSYAGQYSLGGRQFNIQVNLQQNGNQVGGQVMVPELGGQPMPITSSMIMNGMLGIGFVVYSQGGMSSVVLTLQPSAMGLEGMCADMGGQSGMVSLRRQ